MVASYLKPPAVAAITTAVMRAHATAEALTGEVWVVLSRWNPIADDWTSIAPQRVTVQYADRQERTATTDAGQTVTIDGWLTAYEPFDVERKDLFSLGMTGDEERGEIVLVRPARLGTQRAAFRQRLGEQ
jgi:hypothetical protein